MNRKAGWCTELPVGINNYIGIYGPYGEAKATAYAGNGNPAGYSIAEPYYGYNGESYDPMTALQYLRARYYDPQAGRFNVADTYPGNLNNPLTLNLYAYVGNDPINRVDPSGHVCMSAGTYNFDTAKLCQNYTSPLTRSSCLMTRCNL